MKKKATDLQPLKRDFYIQDTLTVARSLLGKILVRKYHSEIYSGIIVETEAYTGADDECCHSFNGKTKRNEIMFEGGGFAYVYFIYGNHYCINTTTYIENSGHAALIRALEPLSNLEEMSKLRNTSNVFNLTNGPGKLCQALRINRSINGLDLTNNEKIFIADNPGFTPNIRVSKRIGVSKAEDKPFRFFIDGNPFVTKHKYNKQSLII